MVVQAQAKDGGGVFEKGVCYRQVCGLWFFRGIFQLIATLKVRQQPQTTNF